MTIQNVIKIREQCYNYLLELGVDDRTESVEAARITLEAVREKAEREDPKPLTLEELRQMDGEPVWMAWPDKRIKAKWWIVGNHEWNVMEFDDPIMAKRYGSVWVAYRYKPKEATAKN